MARITDAERIERLLRTEGGSLGRREIIEALGLSDERYKTVASELVEKGQVVKNRGRWGGLQLTEKTEEDVSTDEAPDPASRSLERHLYPPFTEYLVNAAQLDESRSVVLETHRTRARKWETPDLAEVRVTPFPMVGQWELRIAVYELKRAGSWGVESVLQAATYNEFAQESWLVVPVGEGGDWSERFGKRVIDQAGHLGIGLASFDPKAKILQKHMTPRLTVPSLKRQQEWLESIVGRNGEKRNKAELASHIRWARSKAGSVPD